jgi:RNA polymerase sigma-70 factor (ECF subfamily)
MRDDDTELIARVASHDRSAFETLFHRYYRRLFGFVYRLTRQPELVEEVVSDVLFTVWRDASRFDGRAALSSWILGIAYHKALKAIGVEGRRRRGAQPVELADVEADRGPGPESLMAAREASSALGRALGELSAEQRAVVELAYFEGLSYGEIARILDCPTNTVKTRMFHARRRLRAALPALGVADGRTL